MQGSKLKYSAVVYDPKVFRLMTHYMETPDGVAYAVENCDIWDVITDEGMEKINELK